MVCQMKNQNILRKMDENSYENENIYKFYLQNIFYLIKLV